MNSQILSFIILLIASLANAQTSTSEMSVDAKPTSSKRWGAKIETDAKTTRDKKNSIDGYATETDFQIHQMYNETWGIVGGMQLVNESRDDKKRAFRFDEASLGLRMITYVGDTKWRSQFTYDYLLLSEDRLSDSRQGALSADIRVSLHLGLWGKLRLKFKHSEFLPTTKVAVDIRQTKLELSPAILFSKMSTGLKNKITHVWTDQTEHNTYDIGPFLKYEGSTFEPLVKVMYRPIEKSKSMIIADNWQSKPTYSVELEMNF